LCKTRGTLKSGEIVVLQDRMAEDDICLKMLTQMEEGVWVARPDSQEDTWALLERIGRVPLPPYIRGGEMIDDDMRWYQTVFAERRGSIAAPTAGLHFSEQLLQRLKQQGIPTAVVTLHVGAGTFRPISAARVEEHQLHSEWGEIGDDAVDRIGQARHENGRVVAVGTTTVRVLETAARSGSLMAWTGHTNLFIHPPYDFRLVDALMTNFHLPRSTLLVLVRTFGGDQLIRRAYQEAIRERYRFYSYGDAMLIL
jgi:S-adenosylmethionine:tRNA ribosyltransferase-isomerase